VALAQQVGYTNAGTVEFLVSGEEVFFLEMNTRLQVEHPVTEAVVSTLRQAQDTPGSSGGLDLVALQLRIAAGEPLPFTQDDVSVAGHAFEARVYAEDAFNGFLPQAGVAESVRWPPRARVDAALESGSEVGTSYDPMLGKVIVQGSTREAARRALVTALDETAIVGLTTNLGFLRGLAASDAFRDCEVDTAWLDTHPDAIRPEGLESATVLAAWALATSTPTQPGHPFGIGDGWRLAGPAAPVEVELLVDANKMLFHVDLAGSVSTAGRTWRVHPIASDEDVLRLEVDDLVLEASVRVGPHRVDVAHLGNTFRFGRPDAFGPAGQHAASDGTVAAPMPGTVLQVSVEVGQRVGEGDLLGVMEAMKMELSLKAPVAGTVTTVGAEVGGQVALGATLFVVEEDAQEGGQPEEGS
jgi:3-methylcrotonyl-CoA carboxylase alpha subunit/acetyl-CoA/propionyl-CoA carboxylase biotin carboxyl carrier protein